jgi:hypothetical protein
MTKYTLHSKLQLWATNEEYAIEPYDSNDLPLVINRHSGDISLKPIDHIRGRPGASPMAIYGVMGILKLSTSEHNLGIGTLGFGADTYDDAQLTFWSLSPIAHSRPKY